MRIVKEIPLQDLKVTIFSWNNKYLIKYETSMLEQTYKVPETDVLSEQELDLLLSEEFLKKVRLRFKDMMQDLESVIF